MNRKKIVAALLAFTLVLTAFTGCDLLGGSSRSGHRSHDDDDDDEPYVPTRVQMTGETDETGNADPTGLTPTTGETGETSDNTTDGTTETGAATETTGQTSETTPAGGTTDPTVAISDLPSFGTDVSDQWQVIRNYVQAYHEQHPEAVFGLQKIYGEGDHGFGLVIRSDSEGLVFRTRSGDTLADATIPYIDEDACIPYEMFMQLPCAIETSLIDTDEMRAPSDGVYYGSLLALRLDASEMVVVYGEAFTMSDAEVAALNVGDTVHLPGDGDGYGTEMTVTNITTESSGDYLVEFDNWVYLYRNGDTYMLFGDSDCPVVPHHSLAVIPITPDVSVSDSFSLFVSDREACDEYLSTYRTGNPILDTDYFYSQYYDYEFARYTSDGWCEGYALLFPFTVTDGQATQMNLSWR